MKSFNLLSKFFISLLLLGGFAVSGWGANADLSITKSVDNTTPTVGQNVTFTIVGRNNGPTTTDITITDTLPAGLTWVSDSDDKSSFSCTNSGNAVTCTGSKNFPTNETVTITIVARVDSAGTIVNTASIAPTTSGVTDTITTGNNSASVTLTATTPNADLSVTKSVNNATPTVGQNVTFTIVGRNNGPTTTDITITDTLPTGLTWVSDADDKSSFDCTNSGNAVTCTGSRDFPKNETVTITIVAMVDSAGTITNTASIAPTTSGVTDTITTGNNSASVTLTAAKVTAIEATSQDICYDPVQIQVVNVAGFGMFYGVTTPLRNVSANAISDVTIVKSFNGIDMSMMSKIKLDGTEKTTAQDTDNAEVDQALSATFGSFSMGGMFGKGIVYYPDGDGAFSTGQTHEIYDYSMFSFSWADVTVNALYTKGGIQYKTKVSACPAGNLHEGSRPFTIRNPVNTRNIFGNYFVGGNTNMCITNSNSNFNGTCVNTLSNSNNSYYTKYIDIDSNTSTFNSSNFTLNIPSGSKVIWAGLYWQGYIHNSDQSNDFRETMTLSGETVSGSGKGLDLSVNSFDAEKVFFQTPQDRVLNVNNYQAVVAEQLDFDHLGYAGFKDVTSLVSQMSPNGIYTVANIQSHRGRESGHGNFAGWSLVVIYENSSEDLNNISVFDGYETVDSNYGQDIVVSGFYTPTSGTVNSKLTVFSMEGEGDTDNLRLNGNYLPVTGLNADTGTQSNVFNGSITNVPTRNPILTNNDGLDLDTFDTSSIMTNGQSSATIKMRTSGDRYTPSMLVFFTKLYQPEVCYYEKVYKGTTELQNGAQVNKGDALNVKVYVTNKANETAEKVKVYRTFDTLLPYTQNTTHLDNNNPTYGGAYTMVNQTDNVDTDTFDYNNTDKKFQIRIGTDANSTSGGNLVTNQGAAFDYNITMNSEQNTSISYEVAYTNTVINFDYIGQIGKCVDFNNTFGAYAPPNPGGIDAVSNYTANGYTVNSGLMTRVASQDTTIDVVWFGTGSTPTNYTYSDPMPVMITLSDAACSTDEPITSAGSYATATLTNDGDAIATTSSFTLTSKTTSSTKLRFKYIDWNNLPGGSDPSNCISSSSTLGALSGVPACLNSDTKLKSAFGETIYQTCANSGVRPACQSNSYNASNLPSAPYDNDYGCFMCLANALNGPTCSTDTFSIRPDTYTASTNPSTLVAGENFNLTSTAKGYNISSLTGYNGTAAIAPQTQKITCAVLDGNITNDANATFNSITFDGDDNVSNNIKFGDVGVFDINITDSNWTNVDSSKGECIAGSNTNVADANGKVGCLVRYTLVKEVKPDHFEVNATVANGSNNFTYLNNFDNNASLDQNRSALVSVVVTAKSDTNSTTKNYSSACYAKDGNSTISLSFAPNVENLTQVICYDANSSETNSSSITNPASASIKTPHTPTNFNNGVGTLSYRVNFDRNVTKTVNPFMMKSSIVTIENNESVIGTYTLQPSDGNATFVYGRVVARDVRVFGQKPYNANAWYEVFSTTPPTIGGTALAPSRNDVNWFINSLHQDAQNGDANVTYIVTSSPTSSNIGGAVATGVETYIFATQTPPYSAKAHIDTAPWLWYGVNALPYQDPSVTNSDCLTHPCFNINIVPAVGATGSAKDQVNTEKTDKRTGNATSTWKSTSDYAPAVR